MAVAADPDERLRLHDLLASELEIALNNQGNKTQIVVSEAQEAAYQKIDDLHAHQADTNTLLSKVIEGMSGTREDVARVLTVQGENAARLKKIEDQVDEIDARHGAQWEEAMTLLRQSKEHRAALQQAIDALELRMLTDEHRDRLISEHDDMLRRLADVEMRLAEFEARLGFTSNET